MRAGFLQCEQNTTDRRTERRGEAGGDARAQEIGALFVARE